MGTVVSENFQKEGGNDNSLCCNQEQKGTCSILWPGKIPCKMEFRSCQKGKILADECSFSRHPIFPGEKKYFWSWFVLLLRTRERSDRTEQQSKRSLPLKWGENYSDLFPEAYEDWCFWNTLNTENMIIQINTIILSFMFLVFIVSLGPRHLCQLTYWDHSAHKND